MIVEGFECSVEVAECRTEGNAIGSGDRIEGCRIVGNAYGNDLRGFEPTSAAMSGTVGSRPRH